MKREAINGKIIKDERKMEKAEISLLEAALLTHSGLYLFRADVHAIYLSEVRRCFPHFFLQEKFSTTTAIFCLLPEPNPALVRDKCCAINFISIGALIRNSSRNFLSNELSKK
jgi:hypothetical protein